MSRREKPPVGLQKYAWRTDEYFAIDFDSNLRRESQKWKRHRGCCKKAAGSRLYV